MADIRLLAGPILRRIEPDLVSVWVATSRPCSVELQVFTGSADVAPGLVTKAPTFRGTTPTIRVFEALHVCVAMASPRSGEQPMLPDTTYSYNVRLNPESGSPVDLSSLQLLQDESDPKKKRRLALGYRTNRLPSFALPPLALEDLNVLHGSCRRPGAAGQDAMAFADRLIEASLDSARKRPHLLALTGDQIYADDVSAFLLAEVGAAARLLQGDAAAEQLPIVDRTGKDPESNGEWKDATLANFPIGQRTLYCDSAARFTSQDRANHLLSLGEFAAMYLLVWNNALWSKRPEPMSITRDNLDPLGLLRPVDQAKTPWLFDAEVAKKRVEERKERVAKSSEQQVADEEKRQLEDDRRDLLSGSRGALTRLQEFYDALPNVARVLANVPSLMIFDDHEVTDDWNGVLRFKLEVNARPAGRAILRNGLVAYALFQAWGNNPREWQLTAEDEAQGRNPDNKARRDLLRLIDTTPCGKQSWGLAAIKKLDVLLDLSPLPTTARPVRWHFRYQAQRFDLLGLDSRTRRFFPPGSDVVPPGLIDSAGFDDQIPGRPIAPGVEAVLVLAACPVVGPSLMDELVQPAALRVLHMISNLGGADAVGDERLRKRAKFLDKDPEPWGFEPGTFEALLQRLEKFTAGKPVVFLSGDVHYSTGAVLDYCRGTRRMRFVQLTSSALKNEPGLVTIVDPPLTQRALTEAIKPARLGWLQERPVPFTVPTGNRVPSSQIRNLNRSPLLLTGDVWPKGTQVTRPPDWWWQYRPILDERPETFEATADPALEPRPALSVGIGKPPELPADPQESDYRKIADFHRQAARAVAPRRVVFPTAICAVSFRATPQGPAVRQEIHFIPFRDREAPPKAYTVFTVPLTPDSGPAPTLERADG